MIIKRQSELNPDITTIMAIITGVCKKFGNQKEAVKIILEEVKGKAP